MIKRYTKSLNFDLYLNAAKELNIHYFADMKFDNSAAEKILKDYFKF